MLHKFFYYLVFGFIGLVLFLTPKMSIAEAADGYSHDIILMPGWNVVSTPRLVDHHKFSVAENIANFDVYLLDPARPSGWSAMQEAGQTEFTPLFGYFINNKTGANQTLNLFYQRDVQPGDRLFTRELSAGWNIIGVANPSYALRQKTAASADTNNAKSLLNSIAQQADLIVDLTSGASEKWSVHVSDTWNSRLFAEADLLDDFRETKAYAVFMNAPGIYHGFQNNDPIFSYDSGRLNLVFNGPTDGNVLKNSNNVPLIDFFAESGSDAAVSRMTVKIEDSAFRLAASDINNLELVCGNSTKWLVENPVVGVNVIEKSWSLPAGATDCRLIVDLSGSSDGDERIRAVILDISESSNFFSLDLNGSLIEDIAPAHDMVGNEKTIGTASLFVDIASVPASGQTYVKGQADAEMVGFAFSAGQGADLKITSIKLTAMRSTGDYDFSDAPDRNHNSGAANTMSTIKIYDGATLLGAKSLTIGSSDITVTFDSLAWIISAGQQKKLTVKANISSAITATSSIALGIASHNDITAEFGLGGAAVPATLINGNMTPSIYQILTTAGTLAMALDADTPTSKLVVAGASGVAFTKAKFTAAQEPFIIDRLQVKNPRYAWENDDEFADVVLEYRDRDGNIQTTTKGLSGGVANFTGLTIYVPKDGNTVVTAKANLNTYTGGADNAAAIALDFDPNIEFRAIGQASGITKTDAGSTEAQGNNMTVYKSVPTFAVNSSTPSGTLSPSADTLVGIFNVSADAGDDITFENADSNLIKFAVAGSGTTSSVTWTLKDGDGNTLATTSAALTGSTVTFEFAARSFTVPAGTTKQLKVYTNTSNLGTAGNSIQIYLDDDADTNVNWGINGTGSYGHGTILFRGDLYGGCLVRP